MSRIKVEGALWHPQYANKTDTTEKLQQQAKFARHLTQTPRLHEEIHKQHRTRRSRYARYRIAGGVADGVVMELNDIGDEIQMRLIVSQQPLYRFWQRQQNGWQRQLALLGLRVTLEVLYVDAVS